jgi:hypothetical protein
VYVVVWLSSLRLMALMGCKELLSGANLCRLVHVILVEERLFRFGSVGALAESLRSLSQ